MKRYFLYSKILIWVTLSFISLNMFAQVTQSLWVGQTYTCDAASSMMGSITDVSWSCNGGYISLSGSGFYRDVKATQYWSGTASVTCSWRYTLYYGQSQQSASHTWYFNCRENPVHITPTTMELAVGDIGHVSYYHDYDNSYTSYADAYFSCSSSCVSVTRNGTITAISPGTAYVNVYSKISNAANAPYCKVVVKEIAVTSASVSSPINIYADETKTLTVTASPSNATIKTKAWSIVEGSEYITLTTSGSLTGKKPGTAKIYCTLNNSIQSNIASVIVSEPPFTKRSTSPSSNETGVSAFVTPSVSFSLSLYQGNDFSSIKLIDNDNGTNVLGSAVISDNTIKFIPSSPLNELTSYTFSVPANSVKNKWGTHYASNIDVTFKTGEWETLSLSVSKKSGFVSVGDKVTLNASIPNASIYYTLNGSHPTRNSTLYTQPIVFEKDTWLRAIAFCEGYKNSNLISENYLITNVNVFKKFPDENTQMFEYKDVNPYITFSNAIIASTNINNVKLRQNGTKDIEGDVIVADSSIFIVPNQPLELGCNYQVFIPEDAITTWQGESNDATSWSFSTGDYITAIAMGGPELATAVKTDGNILTWGNRYDSGDATDGSYCMTQQLTPSTFMTEDILSISSGYMHHSIIKNDGSLWMWGRQYCGEFGNNSVMGSSSPIKVMEDVQSVSCGGQTTAIVKNDGSLWMCGRNDFGQIGDSSVVNRSEPVRIMSDVKSATAGWCVTYAIKNDGNLWAWGRNDKNQLGNGTNIDSWIPIKVMEDVAIVSTSATESQWTAAIKKDGSLWTWGKSQSSPTKMLDDVSSVAVGINYIEAVKTDGSLWAWGENSFYQLGNNTTNDSNVPIKIMDDIMDVASGGYTTMALMKNGSVWTWGRNNTGTTGSGSVPSLTAYHSMPTQVLDGRNFSLLTGITSRKKTYQIGIGELNVIDAIPVPMTADYSNISWSSEDENIAEVSERGVIRAESLGETDIVARIKNDKGSEYSMTCHVIVVDESFIDKVKSFSNHIKVWVNNRQLYVTGVQPGQHVSVYFENGSTVYQGIANNSSMIIPVNSSGVYLVKVDNYIIKALAY